LWIDKDEQKAVLSKLLDAEGVTKEEKRSSPENSPKKELNEITDTIVGNPNTKVKPSKRGSMK
jgi:hypothetical protein